MFDSNENFSVLIDNVRKDKLIILKLFLQLYSNENAHVNKFLRANHNYTSTQLVLLNISIKFGVKCLFSTKSFKLISSVFSLSHSSL